MYARFLVWLFLITFFHFLLELEQEARRVVQERSRSSFVTLLMIFWVAGWLWLYFSQYAINEKAFFFFFLPGVSLFTTLFLDSWTFILLLLAIIGGSCWVLMLILFSFNYFHRTQILVRADITLFNHWQFKGEFLLELMRSFCSKACNDLRKE